MCFPGSAICDERFDSYKNHDNIPWDKVIQTPGVVLLRTNEVPATVAYNPVVLVLVRSNLMEMSLSQYDKWNFQKLGLTWNRSIFDPQFYDLKPDVKAYNVTLLEKNAKKIVNFWREKVALMDYLASKHVKHHVIFYEDYQRGGNKYVQQISKALGYPLGNSRCKVDGEQEVRDAHPEGWNAYVSNFDEVKAHFEKRQYATWESIASAHKDRFLHFLRV